MAPPNEFALETFSFSRRPVRPISVSIPRNGLETPPAPPSPFFTGINEDINTEPFPAFDHFYLPPGAPSSSPIHCAFHCDKKVCTRQRRRNRVLPFCNCLADSSSSSKSQPPSTIQPARPQLTLPTLDGNRTSQQALLRCKSPDTEIQIYLIEVQAQLQHLTYETIVQVLRNDSFMAAMRHAFPGCEIQMAVITVQKFFDTMSLYFERTVQRTGSRTFGLEQLRKELDVYLWTMLRDWIKLHCDEEECDRMLVFAGPEIVELVDSGAPAAVLGLWREATQVLVETLVSRHEEVKHCHDTSLIWLLLGCMLFLLVV